MLERRFLLAAGFILVAMPALAGCNKCKDAQKHYCSKLPDFNCYDARMGNAKNKVIAECGQPKATNFFNRAKNQCIAYDKDMKCPTD